MIRPRVFALLAAFIVAPALAQVVQVRPIQRPVIIQPLPEPDLSVAQDPDAATKLMTIEEAQALIGQLRREKRELDVRLTEALANIEQMTRPGGSLVRAYCESRTLSMNTAGASENCAASGYVCGEVDGLCKKSCRISDDCATSFTCNEGTGRCERTG